MKNKNWNEYYNNIKYAKPHTNVIKFLELNINPGFAIDIGCGAGRDTIGLINYNWEVLGIDREDVEKLIRDQLKENQQQKFKFQKAYFGEMELPKSDLIISNFSLPFARKELFGSIWDKITESLTNDGYFVGTFFGKKDSWIKDKKEMIFLEENEVRDLFNKFEIIRFDEFEEDRKTALGNLKHWHIYDVIAKKNIEKYSEEYNPNIPKK